MRDTAACRVGLRPGPHLWSSSYPPFCLPSCFLKSCQSILLRTPSFFAFPGALPFLRTIPVCIDCSQESPTLIGPQHLPAAPGSHSPPRRQCPALPRAPVPFTRTLGSPRGLTQRPGPPLGAPLSPRRTPSPCVLPELRAVRALLEVPRPHLQMLVTPGLGPSSQAKPFGGPLSLHPPLGDFVRVATASNTTCGRSVRPPLPAPASLLSVSHPIEGKPSDLAFDRLSAGTQVLPAASLSVHVAAAQEGEPQALGSPWTPSLPRTTVPLPSTADSKSCRVSRLSQIHHFFAFPPLVPAPSP